MKTARGSICFCASQNIVTNYIQAVIVGVVMFLLAKNVLEANWLSVGALLAVAPALLGVLLIRLQAPFRLGFGERG